MSEAIGEIEIEKLRETHYDGQRAGSNFALDRQTEPLVLPSEISGLDELHAFLKYGNHVTRFSFPYIDLPKAHKGFTERKMDDFLPSPPPAADSEPLAEHKLVPEDFSERQVPLEFGNGQV